MENPVIIFGAKGLGPVALDIFLQNKVVVYGFLDDDASLHGTEVDHVAVLGRPDDDGFLKLIGRKCEAFVAVDDNRYRKTLVSMLNERRKVMPVNALHERAYLASSMTMGHGNFVNVGASLGAFVQIGHHNLVQAGATLDYGVTLGDFVQVGAGSVVGAGATLADEVFVGSGAVIVPGIKVGKGARIGAGSVVIENVAAKATVFGNPARAVE